MTTRKLWLSITVRIVVCTVVLGGAAGIVAWLKATAPKPEIADQGELRARVLVLEAHPTPVKRQWSGFGTAVPVRAADVPSRVTAVVIDRPDDIRTGRAVSTGDLLIQLDGSDFVRQVDSASQAIEDLHAQLSRLDVERTAWADRARVAEEELELARVDFERARQAMASDAAKQREVDQKRQAMLTIERTAIAAREELDKVPLRRASLQAQLAREQTALAQARENASRCRIVAPIDGVLASVDADDGESVTVGQRIARIVNLDRIEVPLLLPSSARPFVRVGDDVALMSEGGNPPLHWNAQVARLSPDDDASTRTFRVFAEVRQDPAIAGGDVLPPGMFVQGLVTSGEATPRSIVPRRSISAQRILLVDDGHIRSMPVTVDYHLTGQRPETGVFDRQWAVLREALPDGALVVLDGSRNLAEGAAALPVPASEDVARNGSAPSKEKPETEVSAAQAGMGVSAREKP